MTIVKMKTATGEEVTVKLAEGAGSGKGKTPIADALERMKPRGLGWKESWTLRVVALGKGNRLPRGFKPAVVRPAPAKTGHFDPTPGPVYYVKQ